MVVDTDRPRAAADGGGTRVKAGDRLTLTDRSLLVLRRPA
ncbi:glycogen debranching enzyme [Streptomyces sp. NBRC 110611]|nr:glycogen debranching enzyme [Streptomyces sp. NBRC 110611]